MSYDEEEGMDVDDALSAIDDIATLIDEEVPDSAWDKAADFFESVKEGLLSMEETIRETDAVTPKQERAIKNWDESVRKWIRD
jgi:hypothetical protein